MSADAVKEGRKGAAILALDLMKELAALSLMGVPAEVALATIEQSLFVAYTHGAMAAGEHAVTIDEAKAAIDAIYVERTGLPL